MLIVQAILVFSLFFIRGTYSEVVTCNHNTPVCDCTATDPNDVCEFTLDIEMLQTFTRYLLDDDVDSRGTAGSVWHINNGEWAPVDPMRNTLCGNSIRSKECTQPFGVDGYTFRSFIAVNGRIPGPTLIVTEDQLVKVTVINRLASESVSVHWHGMHQRNSNWMDGVEHVTQCGIPPGASFTYIFKAEPYGTHWYHSHSGAQRTDGLFGALIVKEKDGEKKRTRQSNLITELQKISEFKRITSYEEIEDNPAEHTITLLDWQKSSSLDLFTQIHSSIRYFNIDSTLELSGSGAGTATSSDRVEIGPVPYWSGLINGRGRHFEIKYKNSKLSNFRVNYEQTYRFRLIGAQSLYAYRFSIEDHKLTVIATDGEYINPSTVNTNPQENTVVDYIIIHSGERYDFLLQTKRETEVGETIGFMMQAAILNFTKKSLGESYTSYGGSAEAILYYGSDESDPPSPSQYKGIADDIQIIAKKCTPTKKCKALNCPFERFPENFNINCMHINNLELLIHYPDNDLPTIATDDNSRLFFNFGFEGTRQTSTINGRNLKLPSASLAQLEPNKLTDIKNNEYCEDAKNKKDAKKCDRDNTEEVISPDCYCTHVVDVEADRSIELVISATGPKSKSLGNFRFAHPVHLHGHYFHVVDIKFGTLGQLGELIAGNSDLNCGGDTLCVKPRWKPKNDYSTRTGMTKVSSKAPLKDTLLIPAGGYAVVYFKTDNPGWWFLHCHIEVHQLEGMGVIINEGGKKTPAPYTMQKCGNFDFTVEEYKKAIKGELKPPMSGYEIATIVLGITSGLFGCILLCIILFCCCYKCCKYYKNKKNSKKEVKGKETSTERLVKEEEMKPILHV